jgi:hypothetical protein
MAKQSGLGDALYAAGYDLSGDSNSVEISSTMDPIDVTGLPSSAMERTDGHRDSKIIWKSFWNPTGAHTVLSALPDTQTLATYCRSTVLGATAFSHCCKQLGYDPSRESDGTLTMAVETVGDQYAGEWGVQLTPGVRVDTSATDGATVDDIGAAGGSLGAQAYLHVMACTAVDCTITVQDSPDDSTWADLIVFTPVATGSAPTWERAVTGPTEDVDRYLRVITSTTGGLTSVSFAVMVVRNLTATAF